MSFEGGMPNIIDRLKIQEKRRKKFHAMKNKIKECIDQKIVKIIINFPKVNNLNLELQLNNLRPKSHKVDDNFTKAAEVITKEPFERAKESILEIMTDNKIKEEGDRDKKLEIQIRAFQILLEGKINSLSSQPKTQQIVISDIVAKTQQLEELAGIQLEEHMYIYK